MFYSIALLILIVMALVIWWKIRNGKGKDDPPSQLKEIKTWLRM